MLRFASLASGSGGNCLIAQAGDTRLLIDCGLKLTETERRLERLGVAPAALSGILVTHEHGDHACGVFDFAAAHRVAVYLTYGTLRDPQVQRALFGRLVPGEADALPGFKLGTVTIRDPAVIATSGIETHLCVDESGDPADRIEGLVLSLTEAELAVADAYETADYQRVTVVLASGAAAFLYTRA